MDFHEDEVSRRTAFLRDTMDRWTIAPEYIGDVHLKGTFEQHRLIDHFMAAGTIFTKLSTAFVTSANDGRHMQRSLHYEDKAVDFRVWGIDPWQRKAIVAYLNHYYSDEDWLYEGDHIHGEYDPK
jgi:hypothetical protein